MLDKNDLEKLNTIHSPHSLDSKVLNAAQKNIAPSKVSQVMQMAPLLAACYGLGILSFYFFNNIPDESEHYASTVVLQPLTFRNNSAQEKVNTIDLQTLTPQQQKDVVIELLMNNDFKQAEKALNWLNQLK